MKLLATTAIPILSLWIIACQESTSVPISPSPTSISQPTLVTELTPPPKSTPVSTKNPTPAPTPEPPDVLFRYMYAVNLLKAAQYEEAIPQFDLVIRMLPNFALAYHHRARAHYRRETPNLDMAREDLDKAIELDPNFAEAYRNRGVLRLNEGDKNGGIIDLQKALVLYIGEGEVAKAALIRTTLEQQRSPLP